MRNFSKKGIVFKWGWFQPSVFSECFSEPVCAFGYFESKLWSLQHSQTLLILKLLFNVICKSANFNQNGPESTYFQLCKPSGLVFKLHYHFGKKAANNMQINGQDYYPLNLLVSGFGPVGTAWWPWCVTTVMVRAPSWEHQAAMAAPCWA